MCCHENEASCGTNLIFRQILIDSFELRGMEMKTSPPHDPSGWEIGALMAEVGAERTVEISSWRAQELVKIVFIEAREKTVQWFSDRREAVRGVEGALRGPPLKATLWGGRRRERVLAAPAQLEFHSRVLRLNIFIAKHCAIYSSNAHQLACPPGLRKFPRESIRHVAVSATRGDDALPTPGMSKAFIWSPHRLG